jgi:hypothetical protein
LGRDLKGKKNIFIFFFKTSFPITLSNQILQYKSPCTLWALASLAATCEGERARENVLAFISLAELDYTTSKADGF